MLEHQIARGKTVLAKLATHARIGSMAVRLVAWSFSCCSFQIGQELAGAAPSICHVFIVSSNTMPMTGDPADDRSASTRFDVLLQLLTQKQVGLIQVNVMTLEGLLAAMIRPP
jgi:hypothetical protein